MQNKITLAVMAAGIGSRFGGLKQIEPFGLNGELLVEYGIYDAVRAGFARVVFILKPEIERDFRRIAGDRLSSRIEVAYAIQRQDDLPPGFAVHSGRQKPWGTAHAVAALRGVVNEPFCVVNADDFYGAESYRLMADFLKTQGGGSPLACAMPGYLIDNTLSENGTVTRGVCQTGSGGMLTRITERYKLRRGADGVIRDETSGEAIADGTAVSMNMFAFHRTIPELLNSRFADWLRTSEDTVNGEYLLPTEVGKLMNDGVISVRVAPTTAAWYGVTYKTDAEPLRAKLAEMRREGKYPDKLWD
ncbi:MAG: nucleotidyltransferase [Oscillospiraceae bacterium]|jgi:hypothetical protein|nr:nucleotidyltransferase [Oscillospiraceae bacterium]